MNDDVKPKRRRLSFSSTILIGLLLGLAWGLFFGESTSWIKYLGDAFVGLLQMTVLPYIALSLICHIGRLSMRDGLRTLRTFFAVLFLLWIIAFVCLAIMSQAFPHWEGGSFYSSRYVDPAESTDWLGLFVPSNPFRSLAENAIPAVVIFSIGLGLVLMNTANKAALLDPLEVAVGALAKLNKIVVKLTPVGMFAIVAYTAGTMDIKVFSLIQGYLLTYCLTAVLVAFVILPLLISSVTPLRYGQVVGASRDPLVAAFVIGNSFAVLPMIIEAIDKLQKSMPVESDQPNQVDYIVPLAYPFPDIGRIVGLIFIPFAAWFYGTSIDADQTPTLLAVGYIGSFGKQVITIPMLLDIANLPSDIFNLFLASGVVAARFGDLMKSMHLIAISILTMHFMAGTARLNWRKLSVVTVTVCLVLLLTMIATRLYLQSNFQDRYSKEHLITERVMLFPRIRENSEVSIKFVDKSGPNPMPIAEGQTRIERIKSRGIIRIGYLPDKVPFSYFNRHDELIGFDVEMAHLLADDLQVNIEFVPIDIDTIDKQLKEDHYDIAMSGKEGSIKQAERLPSLSPYMSATLAIVVADHDKRNFQSREQIRALPDLTLAVVKGSYFADRAARVLPKDVNIVELNSAAEFFDGNANQADGLVISAESGSAWTMLYPQYTVANPLKGKVRIPLYYLTAPDLEFESFINNWLTLTKASGTYDNLFDHWILGKDNTPSQKRWCIIRNVLGWVE